jgi:hypothetical protein
MTDGMTSGMKPLRVVLPVAIAGALLVLVIARVSAANDAAAYRLELEALRREMTERCTVARGASGTAGAEEARAVMRWWFDSVAALRNRHPKPAREALRPPQAKEAAAEKAKDDAAAFTRYAAERLEAIRAGYAPSLSGSEAGLRLDVLGIQPGEHPETHERALRIDFALWGVPRRLESEAGAAESSRSSLRVVVPLAWRQLAFRFLDAGGKTWGEMSGLGDPYLQLRDPERFSPELPPGIVLGTWWVERFPREAARVEITVSPQVQGMTAAALAPTFRWEIEVPEAWKLGPGEQFKGEQREAPPEAAPTAR